MNSALNDLVARKLPMMDAYENKETGDILIDIDLPGIQKDDLKVRSEKGAICIEGYRESKMNQDDHRVIGPVNRWKKIRFAIPATDDMDIGNLVADYSNGVLSLKVPKKEAFKHADIEVNFS